MFNRATYGAYPPGSIFKIIVGLACLESGVVRAEDQFYSKGYYQLNARSKPIGDTAGAGHFDFSRAFLKSSNPYFIEFGLKAGRDRILDMANRFHLGTKYGLPTMQEVSGYIPKIGDNTKVDGGPWLDGDTANLSIGQGEITVTPIQMAVMVAAVANGGKVLNPRLVSRLESQDALGNPSVTDFPAAQVLNDLRVHPEYLQIVRQAMRADVTDPQGTGKAAEVAGMEVCGKTGTAEVKRGRQLLHKITWFSSFAPFSQPRYSVIVMVEEGGSGGGTCAPVAQKIYQAIQKREAGVRNIATAN
jgi:penicillin-binding protein 2